MWQSKALEHWMRRCCSGLSLTTCGTSRYPCSSRHICLLTFCPVNILSRCSGYHQPVEHQGIPIAVFTSASSFSLPCHYTQVMLRLSSTFSEASSYLCSIQLGLLMISQCTCKQYFAALDPSCMNDLTWTTTQATTAHTAQHARHTLPAVYFSIKHKKHNSQTEHVLHA